jgi:opacity protein-like surface antigen
MGVTLGGGLGLIYNVSEKIFLSAEYELLYLTNTFYEHNLTNTATAGIGFKF